MSERKGRTRIKGLLPTVNFTSQPKLHQTKIFLNSIILKLEVHKHLFVTVDTPGWAEWVVNVNIKFTESLELGANKEESLLEIPIRNA